MKLSRVVAISIVSAAIPALFGCSQFKDSAPMSEMENKASAPAGAGSSSSSAPSDAPRQMLGKAESNAPSETPAADRARFQTVADSRPDRYLIRNATLTLEAADARKSLEKLTLAVQGIKGYVSDMHESVDALGARSVTVTVRIPATGFEQSMSALEGLGKVLERQVTAEDVTEEFVDSTARLRNLKRTEERLIEHLTKTGRLSDTLLVEKELSRVRQEAEQIEGRLQFLSHRIAFSTITVTLREAARQQALVPPEHYSGGKIASDAGRSLVEFGQNVLTTIIWLGIWAVVWIPTLFLIRYGIRRTLVLNQKPSMHPENNRQPL